MDCTLAVNCGGEVMSEWLIEQGYEKSKVDECLYVKKNVDAHGREKILYLCLYVDDIFYTGDASMIEEFKTKINSKFQVRHINGSEFLGLQVEYDRTKGVARVKQAKYIDKILRRFGYTECKPAQTPMNVDIKLERLEGECDNQQNCISTSSSK